MKNAITFIFVLIFFCFSCICWSQSEDYLWRRVVESLGEKEVNKYFSSYPNGKYYEQIETRLWGACLANQNKEQCRIFVKFFPASPYTQNALQIMNRETRNPGVLPEPRPVSVENIPPSNPRDPFGRGSANTDEFFEIEFQVSADIESISIGNSKVKLVLNADSIKEGRIRLKKGEYELLTSLKDGSNCKRTIALEESMTIEDPCEE